MQKNNIDNSIQVTRSSMPAIEEYIFEIQDIWEKHWLTNFGIKHKQLEIELANYLKIKYVNLFANGHLALDCIIKAFKLTGDVITTPFTFISTTHAIVSNGLNPVFCDINPNNYTIDSEKIESLITDKTSAIIPVHVYGNLCEVDEIKKIADRFNLKVIYDAAHAFGVTVDGKGVANYGDASIFSFHATKVFNTIEGGAVTFNNENLEIILNKLKNFGISGPESVDLIGTNAKMNEFQAAMGLCNLRHINTEIEKRRIVVEKYYERLNNIKGIVLLKPQQGVQNNYAYFPVLFDGYKKDRNKIFDDLRKDKIYARKYFYPLTNNFECYRNRFDVCKTPVAKIISERILTLPLYADLNLNDVNRICDIILK